MNLHRNTQRKAKDKPIDVNHESNIGVSPIECISVSFKKYRVPTYQTWSLPSWSLRSASEDFVKTDKIANIY